MQTPQCWTGQTVTKTSWSQEFLDRRFLPHLSCLAFPSKHSLSTIRCALCQAKNYVPPTIQTCHVTTEGYQWSLNKQLFLATAVEVISDTDTRRWGKERSVDPSSGHWIWMVPRGGHVLFVFGVRIFLVPSYLVYWSYFSSCFWLVLGGKAFKVSYFCG